MNAFRMALLVTPILALLSQPSVANGPEDVRAAIEAVNSDFAAAFNRGDATAVAGHYTEDGSLLPPGETVVSGRANIEAYWKAGISAGFSNLELKASEIEAHGPMAYEVGEFRFDMPSTEGSKTTAKGKYLVVWKNVDGEWKLHRDMWNDPAK